MKLRYLFTLILSLLCMQGLFLCAAGTSGELKNRTENIHAIGFDIRPSYVIPTHGFYNGWNQTGTTIRSAVTASVNYSFSKPGRGVYQGVGASVHSFFSHDLTGTPASIYFYQGAPIALLSENLAIGYEWNLGLSAGWKDNGIVTVSPLNVYINVAALFTWRMTEHWDLVFGPEYTHFSNGDTKFPNGGANTVNFRIGAKRHFTPVEVLIPERIFCSEEHSGRKMTYDLTIWGAWRADRQLTDSGLVINNKAFPVAGVNFNPLYHFNSFLSSGPSLDLMYDTSADASSTAFISHAAVGLSVRAELKMPIFAVNIGIGYNVLHKSQDLKGLYGLFALKAFMTERLFLNIGYRLGTVPYSHNLMLGLGYRL